MILYLIANKGITITTMMEMDLDDALNKLHNFFDVDIKTGITDFVEMYYRPDQDLKYSLNQLHRMRGLSHMIGSLFKDELERHDEISLLEARNYLFAKSECNYGGENDYMDDEELLRDAKNDNGRFIMSFVIENLETEDRLRKYGRIVHVIDMEDNAVDVKIKSPLMPLHTEYSFKDNPKIWSSDKLFEDNGYDKKLARLMNGFKFDAKKVRYPKGINVVELSEYEKKKQIIDSIT